MEKKRIVIDGANGYVASYFIKQLLSKGNYAIFAFVREDANKSAGQRMKEALKKINWNLCPADGLKVFSYQLLKEDFGLDHSVLKEVFAGKVDYWHFAANLKFSAKDRDDIFSTNVDGVENSLKVFGTYADKSSRYFQVSTAYSCGIAPNPICEVYHENEELDKFRNCYEQSKRCGENIWRNFREKYGYQGSVIRLSQITGEIRTGITNTDYGVCDFVKRLYAFAKKRPFEKVRAEIDPESTQNLMPVDITVEYLEKIMNAEILPPIIHLTSDNPIRNDEILECVSRLMPLTVLPVSEEEIRMRPLSIREKVIAAGMAFTGKYTKYNIVFDTSNLKKIVTINESDRMTKQSFYRMMEYFIKNVLNEPEVDTGVNFASTLALKADRG